MACKTGFEFCGKTLGGDRPPFLVAEIGFNHNGDVELAKRMIEAAALHSADAVKLQTFVAEEFLSTRHISFDPDHPDREIPLYQFFKRYQLELRDYEALMAHARELGIPLFSTPFDEQSLDMLVELGVPAIKIASPDLTHLPFLRLAAKKGLPIVLSTGMGTAGEIEEALKTIREEGNERVILLHCVSSYPAAYHEMNLLCLPKLQSTFNVPVGLSDHTLDNLSAVVATTLGAVMIEKHFTTDRNLPGVDQSISMEPADLQELREATNNVRKILGDGVKKSQPSEEPAKQAARRSLVARVDIEPGTLISLEMVSFKRPGTGLSPGELDKVVGRRAKARIAADQLITWDMI